MTLSKLLDKLTTKSGAEEGLTISLEEAELRTGTVRKESLGPITVELYRKKEDAADVRRVAVAWPGGSIDLLPTKGLTVGSYEHNGWKPFWEPVRPGIVSPERDDLLGDVLVHGERTKSLRWLENFAGCIELLGLTNWGMPYHDPSQDVVLPLHGEASHIPAAGLTILLREPFVAVSGSFAVNNGWWRELDRSKPWYQRGEKAWKVTRNILIDTQSGELQGIDEIENVGEEAMVPDWGYHFQFRAAPGAELRIPSRSVESRFSDSVEEDFRVWRPAEDPKERVERGYIHKGLVLEPGPLGGDVVRGEAVYPDGEKTLFTIPAAAYTLSWFSAGGKGSLEFALPESPEESLIPVPWDGMGPEIGVSALDHDGNVDPTVPHPPLAPGERVTLYFSIARG
ncbi:MAG: DUF4432 family protein [Alkalispirochaetaceae bacterium]